MVALLQLLPGGEGRQGGEGGVLGQGQGATGRGDQGYLHGRDQGREVGRSSQGQGQGREDSHHLHPGLGSVSSIWFSGSETIFHLKAFNLFYVTGSKF